MSLSKYESAAIEVMKKLQSSPVYEEKVRDILYQRSRKPESLQGMPLSVGAMALHIIDPCIEPKGFFDYGAGLSKIEEQYHFNFPSNAPVHEQWLLLTAIGEEAIKKFGPK